MVYRLDFLKEQNISDKLIQDVIYFRNYYKLKKEFSNRIPQPQFIYLGKEIWEMTLTALLNGSHLLLTGPKATGKNVLCDNLSLVFRRPQWNMSFHVNVDSNILIGSDTFKDGEVKFRPGPLYLTGREGGFGILDEINMAKNDSISVIHSALDYRRVIDVPGYKRLPLHEATRFIGTMNYGYAGTRELNEALLSRFLIIDMPPISKEHLLYILNKEFSLTEKGSVLFAQLFMDLQKKSLHSEISSKSIDLRGLLAAIKSAERGLDLGLALDMGIVNKSFDPFEKEIIKDIIKSLFPRNLESSELFQ
ncbi:MAG: MoxR family ATPase [Gallicola sp.]|nr:MoxR family ATPase [Gallicola sp.]